MKNLLSKLNNCWKNYVAANEMFIATYRVNSRCGS